MCSAALTVADISNYSVEVRLLASVWVHDRGHMGQTMSQMMTAFQQRPGQPSPRRENIFIMGEARIFVQECETFLSEPPTNTLNSEVCCCCHFH